MKEDENMVDYLYDKKSEDDLFPLDDTELKRLQKQVTIADKKISDFIATRVHPRSRKKLRKLFVEYSNAVFVSVARENQLYYKYGTQDSINFIINALSAK